MKGILPMKKAKWLVLTLLLLLVLGVAFACGPKGPEGITADTSIFEGTKWEGVDFSGTVLKISISVEQYNNKASIPSSDRYIKGLDSAVSDDVINKVMSEEWKVYDAKVTAVQAYSNRAIPAHFNCIQFSDVAAQ